MELVHGAVIEAIVSGASSGSPPLHPERLDSVAFEQHCVDSLCASGWTARLTRSTGDQGADVVAELDGVRVVLQCKWYGSSVGNGAVQEVLAGLAYEGGDVGCVVSNADYTVAAQKLASAAGVLLLHYDDLPRLSQLISSRVGGADQGPNDA